MDQIVEAISIKYNNIVYEMKAKGQDVIVLSLGEAFFKIPLYSFKDLPFPDLYHYSHSRGLFTLRKKISDYFKKEYDFYFNPTDEIIITAGSKIAIHMTFMALLNPGDEVIIFEPYWVSYTEQVKLCNAIPVCIPIYQGIMDVHKYISNKTKCIVINNPNNPSGKIFSQTELEKLLEIARKYNLYVLSDEAYSDFVPKDKDFHSLGKIDRNLENSIICNSISKNYGISGWRLGYVISNKTLSYQILKINQHLITCPATILEMYIEKHFEEIINITKPQISAVVKFRKKVKGYLIKKKLEFLEGDAAWYFFVSISPSKLNSDNFCTKLLTEHNISVVPGIGYGVSCDKYIRISVGCEPWERVKLGIDTIKYLIETTK